MSTSGVNKSDHVSGSGHLSSAATKLKSPKSPHLRDSIESHPGASKEISQGFIAYTISWVSYIAIGALDGLLTLCSFGRWALSQIGLMNPVKNEEPTEMTWEQKKEGMSATFVSSTHIERLCCFSQTLSKWNEPEAKAFFISLFNQQDDRILDALALSLQRDIFPSAKEDVIKGEMASHFYSAFNASHPSFAEKSIQEVYQNFMLEFPEHVLDFAKQCFSSGQPSSSHFEAIAVLARRLDMENEGFGKEFHSSEIGKENVANILEKAIEVYFGRLTTEEKNKILACFNLSDFEEAMDTVDKAIVDEWENPSMQAIFSDVYGFDASSESGFRGFVESLNSKEKPALITAVFDQFPGIRDSYFSAAGKVFLGSEPHDQESICMWTYRNEPNIIRNHLLIIGSSNNEREVGKHNQELLASPHAAFQLFKAYRNVIAQENIVSAGSEKLAYSNFDYEWDSANLVDSETGQLKDLFSLAFKLQGVQMSPAYKKAARAVLEVPLPKEKSEGKETVE